MKIIGSIWLWSIIKLMPPLSASALQADDTGHSKTPPSLREASKVHGIWSCVYRMWWNFIQYYIVGNFWGVQFLCFIILTVSCISLQYTSALSITYSCTKLPILSIVHYLYRPLLYMLVVLLELIRYSIHVNHHIFAMLNFCGRYIEVNIILFILVLWGCTGIMYTWLCILGNTFIKFMHAHPLHRHLLRVWVMLVPQRPLHLLGSLLRYMEVE